MKKILFINFLLIANLSFGQNSLDFDGINGYGSAALSSSGFSITIEMWVKPHVNQTKCIFSWGDATNDSQPAILFLSRTDQTVDIFISNGYYIQNVPLTTGVWTHLALVKLSNNTWTLYANGTAAATSTAVIPGAHSNIYLANGLFGVLDGQLDEVRIWDKELSASEISSIYNKTFSNADPNLTSCLKAYYKMTNGSGTSLSDNSGNSNTMTLQGGATWSSDEPSVSSTPVNDCSVILLPCTISTVALSVDGSCGGLNAVFDISFDVSGGSGNYEVFNTADNMVLGTLTSAVSSGNGLIISGSLMGPTTAGTINVDVRDSGNILCLGAAPVTVNIPECVSMITNDDANGDGTPDIADPCDCSDPMNPPSTVTGPSGGEVFHELVTVTSGAGETWTMDATTTGALDATGAALALPTVMTEISPGVYTLDFYHEINVGYTGNFSNGTSTLNISNTCTATCSSVPTLGEWGLIIFTLLMLNMAVLFVVRRKRKNLSFAQA